MTAKIIWPILSSGADMLMKTYAGVKPCSDIIDDATKIGLHVDDKLFGKDHLLIWGHFGDKFVEELIVCTFSGQFVARRGEYVVPATECSEDMQGEGWYDAILDLIYIPKDAS